jgi:membrane-bound ClpP family serine protease
MSGRLLLAIISTAAEETGLLVLGLWILPRIKVNIPWPVILLVMLAWLGWSVFTYRKGSKALSHKPVPGMAGMVGSIGIAVQSLQPDGMVRIKGELWHCRSDSGDIKTGATVKVIKQDGLKLVVQLEPGASGK